MLAFIATLPASKQQPNLLLAAVRHVCGTPDGWAGFRAGLIAREAEVRATMLARNTQTNEPGRCAVLLPLLSRLPGPLALIEVGASAGLCLLPDRYMYDYGGGILRGPKGADHAPVFNCGLRGGMTAPVSVPEICWRAGLDLNPIDPRDPDQSAWLETLVWPDQPERLSRLRAALAVARADPPPVRKGNLLHDLAPLIAEAPRGATVVVFHTAVLAYVTEQAARDTFASQVRASGAAWISNEVPGVFPEIAARAGLPRPAGAS